MKRFFLLVALIHGCVCAMDRGLEEKIKSIDSLPDFCLELEQKLSGQPLHGEIVSERSPYYAIAHPEKEYCRVLQLSQQEEALFEVLRRLGKHTMETGIEEECGRDPQGRAFFASTISDENDVRRYSAVSVYAPIIVPYKYGIFRSDGCWAKVDTIQRAIARVVKDLRSGWHVVTTLPCKDIPKQGAGYIILRKPKNPSLYLGGQEDCVRDNLIDLLLEIFQLKDDVHHIKELYMWNKPREDPSCCARYLWFRPEIFERVQTCFGFEIAGAHDHPANNVIPANPTPLHDIFDQEGFSLVGLFT